MFSLSLLEKLSKSLSRCPTCSSTGSNTKDMSHPPQMSNLVHRFKLKDMSIHKPLDRDGYPLTPNMCRLRNMTYSAKVFIDIEHEVLELREVDGAEEEQLQLRTKYEGLELCQIPIMLKSEYCWLNNCTEKQLCDFQECTYDNGG